MIQDRLDGTPERSNSAMIKMSALIAGASVVITKAFPEQFSAQNLKYLAK